MKKSGPAVQEKHSGLVHVADDLWFNGSFVKRDCSVFKNKIIAVSKRENNKSHEELQEVFCKLII